MQFEKLKKDNHKKIIIGGLILVGILSTLILTTTRAKYKTTQSINIVNGTINYKPYDFKVLAMYKQKEGSTCTENNCYEEITGRMPTSGYAINESKSYCTLDGTNRDTEAKLKTTDGHHVIENLAKNEKCKLYFDKTLTINDIIASLNIKTTTPDYTQAATTDEGVYKILDGMYGGYSYVWRGAVSNNWIKFGGFYWRIIRTNGDGTIRMIYQGKEEDGPQLIGTKTQISNDGGSTIRCAYNAVCDRSEYVGYTYTTLNQRPTGGTNSIIKGIVDDWYSANIGNNITLASKIADGKYCNDRNTASAYIWSSQPSRQMYYAARERLQTNKAPTLSCTNFGDVYILKAGLITADEVNMAGGVFNSNKNYYLYTNQYYWTMTPRSFDDSNSRASGYYVTSYGTLGADNLDGTWGVRPVINLKADTTFKAGGTGASENPYVVQ